MKKNVLKIVLLLIAAVMLVSIVFAGAASATEVTASNWTELNNAFKDSAVTKVTLGTDIQMEDGIDVTTSITLDLNGKTLTATKDKYLFFVQTGADKKFTLADSTGGGKLEGNGTGSNGGGVNVFYSGVFIMTGGTITNCSVTTNGGGVYVNDNGVFNMTGGTITNCSATTNGGGVYVSEKGAFNMTDGTITNCSTTGNSGGGVHLEKNGKFTMNGGTIANCSATSSRGGGVYVKANGMFTMNGGTITNCSVTTNNGGGVYVEESGVFNMTDGTITNCTASEGGGVYLVSLAKFTMTGGTITNCSADSGGGVYVNNNNGVFTMTGGTITNCSAKYKGGGVYVNINGLFNVNGTATIGANAVALNRYGSNYAKLITTPSFKGSIDNITLYNGGDVSPSSWENKVVVANGSSVIDRFKLSAASQYSNYRLKAVDNDLVLKTSVAPTYVEVSTWAQLNESVAEWNATGAEAGKTRIVAVTKDIKDRAGANPEGINVTGNVIVTTNKSATPSEFKIDGNLQGRLFNVAGTGNLTLVGNDSRVLNLTNGDSAENGGGIKVNANGNLTLADAAVISNCSSAKYGGGVFAGTSSHIAINGGKILNCSAQFGGGIASDGTSEVTTTMKNGSIIGCTAEYGGGIYAEKAAKVELFGGRITDCNVTRNGGGVYLKQSFGLDCYIDICGDIQIIGNKNTTADNNIYLFNESPGDFPGLNLVGELTGKVGITFAQGNYPQKGEKFGAYSAMPYPGGAENFFADTNSNLIGYDGESLNLLWKEVNFVAEIVENGTRYESVNDAFNATDAKNKTIRLLKDSTLTGEITVNNKEVILNLSGYNLTAAQNERLFYVINEKANLTLMSSDGEGKLIGNGMVSTESRDGHGGGIYVAVKGKINLHAGVNITNCSAYGSGGGVYVEWGTFNMNGGTIFNCRADHGGGVYVSHNGATTFVMTGGTIANCTAKSYGGGVYVYYKTFNMNGGTIFNCSASQGGGVYVNDGTFTMNGGNTSKCQASLYGGGVYVSGTFNMNGGTIANCTAKYNGGGVYFNKGAFKVGGAVNITGNKMGTNPNNVYLTTGMIMTVVPPMASSAQINVTTKTAPGKESPVNITSVCGADNATHFGSDNASFFVTYNENTQTVQLNTPWSVTYDGNGNTSGTVPIDTTAYTPTNNQVTVQGQNTLAKTGHNFTGWKNATGYVFKPNDKFTIAAATTLYANWTVNSYHVYNKTSAPEKGTETVNKTEQNYGEQVLAEATANPGYHFVNWTCVNLTSPVTNNPYTFTMPASDVNVTANFAENVTILHLVNSSSAQDVFATYKSNVLAPDIMIPESGEGHTFNGWNLSDGTNLINATGKFVAGVNGYTNASGYWNNTALANGSTVQLTENWTVNTYNITYIQPLGGSVEGAETAAYGSTVEVTVTTDSGYTFKELTVTGNETGETVPSSDNTFTMPAFDVDVTAVFTKNSQPYTPTPSHKESGQTVIQQQVQDVSADPTPANQATADISVNYVGQSVLGTSASDTAALKEQYPEAAAQFEIAFASAEAAGIPLTNSKGAKAVVVTSENIPNVEKVTFSRVYEISPANEGEKLTKVTVKVPKSDITSKGLTSEDVNIYHYLESYNIWVPLETLSVSQDENNYYYTAATDGTSPFGVLIKKIGSDTTTTPTTQPTQKSPAPLAGLVLGLGAVALLLRMRR